MHLTDTMTDEQTRRRLEHKYSHRRLGRQIWAAQQRRLTGLNRRYAHLHAPSTSPTRII